MLVPEQGLRPEPPGRTHPLCRSDAERGTSVIGGTRNHWIDGAQAYSAWDTSRQPAWLTSEVFSKQIQPLLADISTSAIRSRIAVPRWYAGRIRQGYRPHPRHWRVLAELVGVSQDVLTPFTGPSWPQS